MKKSKYELAALIPKIKKAVSELATKQVLAYWAK